MIIIMIINLIILIISMIIYNQFHPSHNHNHRNDQSFTKNIKNHHCNSRAHHHHNFHHKYFNSLKYIHPIKPLPNTLNYSAEDLTFTMLVTKIFKWVLKHPLPRHCPVATRVRRGNTLDGRDNSIGEEDEEEDVGSNGEGARRVEEKKRVDILKQKTLSHNISKSCSPPRLNFSLLI